MSNSAKHVSAVPTSPDELFERLPKEPGVAWLDSSLQSGGWGQQSVLAVRPVAELRLQDGDTHWGAIGKTKQFSGREKFFDELDRLFESGAQSAIGYLSYEATLPWLGLKASGKQHQLPEAHFFIYDDLLRFDHVTQEFDSLELAERWSDGAPDEPNLKLDKIETNRNHSCSLTKDVYLETVNKIKRHIKEGDIYQANLTCRFDLQSIRSARPAYQRLRKLNPAPYAAFVDFGGYQILSSSPERMFRVEHNRITSSPIKGTIARGTPEEDQENLARLLSSVKDRAELLMIVDLVRNDLGRIAATGSVHVEKLFRAEIYSSLIHLISDISAELPGNIALSEIFAALLPGGSITGAPKRRAAEIIDENETVPRHVYTGCIGMISRGVADFNIAIRTMTARPGSYSVHAGGGIVADSEPEAEFKEMMLKARNLFRALETNE